MVADAEQLIRLNELRSLRQKQVRLKELRQSNGLEFYRPHAKQDKFHLSGATGRYGRTGNRFGKSEMGTAESIAWCLGGRTWYRHAFDVLDGERRVVRSHEGGADHSAIRANIPSHPVKGLLLVVDWDMAKRIFTNREGSYETWGKLFKFLPKDAVGKVHMSRGGHVDMIEIKRPIEFGGGSSTLSIDTIESWKHNKLGGESADWDFIHIDEPCPEKMFKGHARGLMDRNGRYWFTCTPLDEMWINDLFTPPGHGVVSQELAANGLTFGTKFIVAGAIYDNPYRTPAGVAEFESTLTREEKACRLHGLPLGMAGLVYKEFQYDAHVLEKVPEGWRSFEEPPLDHTIRVAWDVHQRIPQAVLKAATAPNGDVFIYEEQFFDSLIGPNADALSKSLRGRYCVDYLIDPFAIVPSAIDGSSVLTALRNDHDLYFKPASKDLDRGVSAVRERLAERNFAGRPTIYFSPNLRETLFEFSHYVYDLDKNRPKDKDDHMMENLYRLVLNGLEYVAPLDEQELRASRRTTAIGFGEDRRHKLKIGSLLNN